MVDRHLHTFCTHSSTSLCTGSGMHADTRTGMHADADTGSFIHADTGKIEDCQLLVDVISRAAHWRL